MPRWLSAGKRQAALPGRKESDGREAREIHVSRSNDRQLSLDCRAASSYMASASCFVVVFSIMTARTIVAIRFKPKRMNANLLPGCVISNSIIGIFVVDQAPRKMKILVRETPFLRKTIATGKEAYNGPEEKEPKTNAKMPPYREST